MAGMMADIELCVPALRRYAGALLHDREEADDLVHASLTRAISQLDAFGHHDSVRPWLFAILHTVFADRKWRSTGRRPMLIDSEPKQQRAPAQSGLMRALDELTQEERSVLLLVCVENFSYGDVSRVLAVPISEVLSCLSRARAGLQRSSAVSTQPALGRME